MNLKSQKDLHGITAKTAFKIEYFLIMSDYITPVMYVDPSGLAPEWWQWGVSIGLVVLGAACIFTGFGGPLGGALIASGVNSLISGYINEANGGSFTAGWIGGGVAGFVSGLAAGLGGKLMMSAADVINFGAIGRVFGSLALAFGGGFIGGFSGSVIIDTYDGRQLDITGAFNTGVTYGALNMFAAYGSGASSLLQNAGYRTIAVGVSVSVEGIYDFAAYGISKIDEFRQKLNDILLN